MIEATCGACGTVARIAEADVPVGAKFVTCAQCKSRVPLPQKAGASPPGPPKVPALPPIGKTPPPTPSMSSKPTVDLADLPAPKRNSPLAGAAPSKPAPPSSLAGADLPAPKSSKPAAAPSALDLDDLMPSELPAPKGGKSEVGLADLPAPKARASALGDAPPSKPQPSALADLPAPKAKPSALADLPAPKAKPSALTDLPAPKKPSAPDLGDLPPPRKAAAQDLDLPAPKRPGDGDLPAPKRPGDDNLPAPKRPGAPAGTLDFDDGLDLPMPANVSDLPTPKPGANNDLPAPKGFFDDLPQPARHGGSGGANVDVPAPKGFFDDLPQPAKGKQDKSDLPAPKGFFDDLPQPAKADAGAKGGFFDDLPQPTKPAAKPAAGKPAAGGLFDDIPQPAKPASGGPDGLAFGGDLDLGGPSLELDTGPSGSPSSGFGTSSGSTAGDVDLGLPLGQSSDFTDLDLADPSAKSGRATAGNLPEEPASPIKIKTPKGGAAKAPIPITVKKDEKADLKLDLADDPHAKQGGTAATVSAGGKAQPRRGVARAEETPEDRAAKRKRTRVVLASVLGVALLGAGGFYFYQKHTAAQARADEIDRQVTTARKHLADEHPQHWQRAAGAAQAALDVDKNNGTALGLAAEAALAGALDNGVNYPARVAHGRKLTQDGLGAGKTTPELQRAQALMAIAANDAASATKQLDALIAQSPRDGWLQLYMGWAQLAKNDADAAIKAFDQAVALSPATKLPALYGHGKAKLLKADIEGARTAFTGVLEKNKDHIGAMVGLAATLPPQQSAQREADLLAILERPEIKTADPRAVVQAWTLLGDIARNSGRYDVARERYRKALAITKTDIPATLGLAAVEMRDGKQQIAIDLLTKAAAADKNNAEVQLLAAELDIEQGKLPDAETAIGKLAERKPPLPTLQMVRLHVVRGKLFEKQGKTDEAIAEYSAGAKLAGDLDLTPTMAAVKLLSDLAKKAAETDPAKAENYRKQANELLSALAARAQEDAELSLTLGNAYLQSGDPVKAEQFLSRATAMREKDVESRLQLGKALIAQNKTDEAIRSFKDALALDGKRGDVALELARTYQNAGRHDEAMPAYEKLLADPAVPVITRVNAGKYFAMRGARDKAAAQAEPILKEDPDNPGGLYLKGEGLMLAGKWDEARITLTRATDLDPSDAQYLDALGRALEGSLAASGDTKYIEGARHAYERATKVDPKMFHPHLGLGRSLVAANKFRDAIQPLSAASAIDKSNADVMYNMGLAYFGVRSDGPAYKKTAADWLEAALKAQPPLPLGLRADAAWRLGQVYKDLNKGPQAAAAFETATKMGEDVEKETGKTPEWLVSTYYELGDIYHGLNNKAAQKRAWQKFVDRKPPPGVQKKTAEHFLNTEGKNY